MIKINKVPYLIGLTPIALNISSIKHHFVKEDCNKLAPTNSVNQMKLMFTKYANSTVAIIKLPAIALIYLSIIIYFKKFSTGKTKALIGYASVNSLLIV